MLIKCPECDLPVSDKALNCPHCGYPIVSSTHRTSRSSKKRMRLPNGFGQITEIKNKNLRKPFRAMVTVGKTEDGKIIKKLLKPEAYFETYNDAYAALVEYNRSPYDLSDFITVKQLYERWSKEYFATLESASSKRTIIAAWKYCTEIYDLQVNIIRARHLKGCIENCNASPNTKSRMKSLFNLMFDYAVEYEIAEKNYARDFALSADIVKEVKTAAKGHYSFTDDEMSLLWGNEDLPYVNIILYQCYSGWRPQEVCNLKLADVDLEAGIVKGGMKTAAGKNRIVPIHSCIRHIVEMAYDKASKVGSEYLFDCDGEVLTYDKYNKRFHQVKNTLKLGEHHRPHDPRKQFITACKNSDVNEYAIKRMVGHAIEDITEKLYTDRDIEWLKTEIEKIKKEQSV